MTTRFDRRFGLLPENWENQSLWVDDDEKFGAWLRHIMHPYAPTKFPSRVREPKAKDMRRIMEPVHKVATRVRLGLDTFERLCSSDTAHLVHLVFYVGRHAHALFWDADVPGIFARAGETALAGGRDVDGFLEKATSELAEAIRRLMPQPEQEQEQEQEQEPDENVNEDRDQESTHRDVHHTTTATTTTTEERPAKRSRAWDQ
jgi:hypothetical protein